MFLENNKHKGWIEVICGSMFSGKTEELIRRMKRAQFANLKVEIFKPSIDVRYSEEEVVSHDANAIQSTPVESAQNILLMTSDVDVVGTQHDLLIICRKAVRMVCQVTTANTDGMHLSDILRRSHKRGHRTKGHTPIVHIETRNDNADTAICQLAAHIDDAIIEELRLIDAHDIHVRCHKQDILRRLHGR